MGHHEAPDAREQLRHDELGSLLARWRVRLPAALARRVSEDLDAVADRLALGVEHHVVALVGGTGSGKSALFNAVTGLDVADVGAVRPSTSVPTACSWGSPATALLDRLGVPPERRHRGEMALAGPQPGQLDGVVLLDLPDHDSVARGHREQVDRFIPLVDLLVWVLDPQKYADNRVHADYLAALTGRSDAMVAVLNQVDTLTPEDLAQVRLDVARLLVSENLGDVEIVLASALTGQGVGPLRETIRRLAERASVNRVAVWDQLDGVGRLLVDGLGAAPGPGVDTAGAAQRLADAIGLDAVTHSLHAAVTGGVPVAQLGDAPVARMEGVRADWLAAQAAGLAPAWADAVDAALPSAQRIGEAATQVVRQVPVPAFQRPGMLARLRTSVLTARAETVMAQYAAEASAALEGCVRSLLAPSQSVRQDLVEALRIAGSRSAEPRQRSVG